MGMYKTLAPGCIGHREARFMDAAETAARHGFAGYWFDITKDSETSAEQTAALLQKHNLKPAGFGLPVEYRKGEEEYREGMAKLASYLDWAKAVGLERCITWIIPSSDTLTYEENFELHRSRLAPCAQMMKERGILFGLEFLGPKKLRKGVKHEFIHSLPEMLKLCDAIGTGNCGILMDLWHWDLAGQTRDDFAMFKNPNQIVCVHIMDAPEGVPEDEQEDLVRRLPGATGILRAREFFDGLRSVGYEGPVLAEPFEKFLADKTLDEACAIVMDAINMIWPKDL